MDYARALVEHPKWRWEPGMGVSTPDGTKFIDVPRPGLIVSWSASDDCSCNHDPDDEWLVPDINHPATKGWLLHMLREAVEGHAFCDLESTEPDEWRVNADYLEMDGPWDFPTAPTEGEALAAALLAVWGPA